MATAPIVIDPYQRLLPRRNELGAPLERTNELGAVLPNVAPEPVAPPPTNARLLTQDAVQRDQQNLQRISSSPSGIDSILHPADGHQIGTLRRIGGIAAKVGETALTGLSPFLASLTPGTGLHKLQEERTANARLQSDLGSDYQQAKTGQEDALTAYTAARPDIEQSKIDQRQSAVEQRVGQAAAARGQKVTWDPNTHLPTFEDDHESQAFADHQALSAMHEATAEKSKIQADIAKNHYIPGTPEFQEAQRKLQQVDSRLGVAMQSLGLRAQGVQMRRETLDANLYGKGADGQPLVGAPQIVGEDGQAHTVGLRAANTAIKQQKGVGTFNDLVGSVDTSRKALEALHSSGGSFADAGMIAAMNDPHSMVGKYVNGQLVKGNLNDTQIEALGAVNQLREQIGILRASTGGTAAEAQAQRMLDTLPTAGDSPAIVRNKLKQIDGVLERLSPSVTSVRGGLSVGARPSASPSGTVTMRAPTGETVPVPANQVDHYKSLGAKVVQ